MRLSNQTIQNRAEKLLKETGVRRAPVDVERIALSLKVDVRKTPAEDDLSGFLLKQPNGRAVIGVNSLHHPNRQRFTIAHEIGHFMLHEQDQVHVDRLVMRLRSSASSTGENHEEVEANRFAAEILMPQALLKEELRAFPRKDLLDDRRMQQLAKKYKVSVQAMTNRLISLGYIQAAL